MIMAAILWVATSCGNHEHSHDAEETEMHDHNGQSNDDHAGHDHSGHDHSADDNQAAKDDKSGPEYTSAYICPMHCKGSGSDKPGTCPVCGMDYVKNEDYDE